MAIKANPKELLQQEPFSNLFAIDATVQEKLVRSMKESGYDLTKPVYAWRPDKANRKELVLVEGHMRVKAAIQARIREIPVEVRFEGAKDAEAAWEFAIASQEVRRNVNPIDLVEIIAERRLARAAVEPEAESTEPAGRGRKADPVRQDVVEKAAELGISERTAERGLSRARAKATAPKSKATQARELKGAKAGKALEPLRSALLIGQSAGTRYYWPKSLYGSMEAAEAAAKEAGVLAPHAGLAFTQYRARGEFQSLVDAITEKGGQAAVLPSQAGVTIEEIVRARDAAVESSKTAADLVSAAAKADGSKANGLLADAVAQAADAARLWSQVEKVGTRRLDEELVK
jgi:hypothetical protein